MRRGFFFGWGGGDVWPRPLHKYFRRARPPPPKAKKWMYIGFPQKGGGRGSVKFYALLPCCLKGKRGRKEVSHSPHFFPPREWKTDASNRQPPVSRIYIMKLNPLFFFSGNPLSRSGKRSALPFLQKKDGKGRVVRRHLDYCRPPPVFWDRECRKKVFCKSPSLFFSFLPLLRRRKSSPCFLALLQLISGRR